MPDENIAALLRALTLERYRPVPQHPDPEGFRDRGPTAQWMAWKKREEEFMDEDPEGQ